MNDEIIDIEVECDGVQVDGAASKYTTKVKVKLSSVSIQALIAAIGQDEVLDQIGQDTAIEHFGLELQEET